MEPMPGAPNFASTYDKLMTLVLKRCGKASDNEVVIDLAQMDSVEQLNSKYHLISVAQEKEQIIVSTGHAHNHAVSPPVEVSIQTY